MLEFNETTQNAKIFALYYANLIGDPELIGFMSSQVHIQSAEQAARIVEGFKRMTDLAVEDHHNDVSVEGITDIEFWMHTLFNKVYGDMVKNGFAEVWDQNF